MIASISFPITDCRGLFETALGRIDNHRLAGWQPDEDTEVRYLRSIGLPSRRRLGPGPYSVNEYFHFTMNKAIEQYQTVSNKKHRSFKRVSSINRYFQLDDIAGRADICAVYRAGSKKIEIEELYSNLQKTQIGIKFTAPSVSLGLFSAGPRISSLLQSRTTKEYVLRDGGSLTSVFSGIPIVFVEGLSSEIRNPESLMQRVDTGIKNIRLFHGYVSEKQRAWMILRDRNDRDTYLAARSLRMVLLRLYCQQSTFRSLVRHLPSIHDAEPQQFIFDAYSAYLVRNRRLIASLCKSVTKQTGYDFGPAAKMASDMIRPDEIDQIAHKHEEIVNRREVVQNIIRDIKFDSSKQSVSAENKNSVIFGKSVVNQTIILAPAAAPRFSTSIALSELADTFAIYGELISEIDQLAASKIIEDMARVHTRIENSGPLLANKIAQLRKVLSKIKVGRISIENTIRSLEESLVG